MIVFHKTFYDLCGKESLEESKNEMIISYESTSSSEFLLITSVPTP